MKPIMCTTVKLWPAAALAWKASTAGASFAPVGILHSNPQHSGSGHFNTQRMQEVLDNCSAAPTSFETFVCKLHLPPDHICTAYLFQWHPASYRASGATSCAGLFSPALTSACRVHCAGGGDPESCTLPWAAKFVTSDTTTSGMTAALKPASANRFPFKRTHVHRREDAQASRWLEVHANEIVLDGIAKTCPLRLSWLLRLLASQVFTLPLANINRQQLTC